MLGQLLETLSGHWAVHLESRVPRTELYEARIASSKPSLRNPRLWSKVRLMYNNVSVLDNHAIIQLVLNAPEDLLDQVFMDQIYAQMRKKLDYSVLTILKSRSVSSRTGCIAMTNLA